MRGLGEDIIKDKTKGSGRDQVHLKSRSAEFHGLCMGAYKHPSLDGGVGEGENAEQSPSYK